CRESAAPCRRPCRHARPRRSRSRSRRRSRAPSASSGSGPFAQRSTFAAMKVRRVVTGHDETGRSVFASDEDVDPTTVPLFAGWEFLELWGGDATPSYPDDGGEPEYRSYFPNVDGFRFSFSVIPPEGTAAPDDLDLVAAEREARDALPGMLDVLEPDDP